MSEAGGLSSVRNAARLLKAFTSKHRMFGVTELAQYLGLSTSTVHRLLVTLESEHVIEQDPDTGKYRLGLAVYDLTAAMSAGSDLSEALLPPMTVLRNRTGEAVQVAVLDGRQVVYVERLDSPHMLRLFLEVGRRNWAHCTSTGKVLLAYVSPSKLDRLLAGWDLPAVTPHTVTDPELLRKQLAEIRDRGYAENQSEAELGVTSLGAPIRDGTGQPVAAMSVAGPTTRMDSELERLRFAVMEAAAVASRRLGHEARK